MAFVKGLEVKTLVIFVLELLFITKFSSAQHKYNALVNTIHGPVEGFSVASQYSYQDKKRINIFLGIPYAKRKGQFDDWKRQFRFKKPELPYWGGIWDATYYRPACPQPLWYVRETVPNFSAKDIDEDCLYMNIYSPNKTDEPASASPSLYPVMVFIHGGGFTLGASQQYPGIFLAERNVVVVTFNYRLGPLGFLSTNDRNAIGNYGMWDQLRALEFIRDNIRYFRGNPGVVTLFGSSTGAAAVGLHLLSPRTVYLFSRAILQSGSDRSEWAVIDPITDAAEYAKELAREVGCPTNNNFMLVQCLQLSRSDMEIVNASFKIRLKNGKVGNPWGPVVDGPLEGVNYAFLPDTPKSMREQQRFKKYHILAGLNKDDGSFFIPNLPTLTDGISNVQFDNIIYEFLNDRKVEDMTNTMEALTFQYTYWPQPKNFTMVRQKVVDMMSDYMFGTGMDEVLKAHVRYNKTYVYVFNYFSWNDYLPKYRGIAHGQELQYVFGFPFINETYREITGIYPRQHYDYADRNMSEYMINLWTNFSSSGNPTPRTFDLKFFRNITWGEYNLYNHSYLAIGNSSHNLTNYRQTEFAFWRDYFPNMWNRPSLFTTPKSAEEAKVLTEFKSATWALTSVGIILVILVVSLYIVICRRRPKDY